MLTKANLFALSIKNSKWRVSGLNNRKVDAQRHSNCNIKFTLQDCIEHTHTLRRDYRLFLSPADAYII